MIWRGYSVLALLSLVMLVGALILGVTAGFTHDWFWAAEGGILALVGLGLAQLSVLDG